MADRFAPAGQPKGMAPTVGRVVHFHAATGKMYAAIITKTYPDGETADLAVFPPAGAEDEAVVPFCRVRRGEGVGRWSWPVLLPA